jgi:hypothetical protein
MTVTQAIALIRDHSGVVENRGGSLKLKFPEQKRVALEPAIETLRTYKSEVLALLAPTDHEIQLAMRFLNLAGVRIIRRDYDLQIGVWEDLDGVEIRQALRTVGLDAHPIVHLESAGVDLRYNVRRTPDRAKGEPFAAWLTRAEEALPAVVAAYQQR